MVDSVTQYPDIEISAFHPSHWILYHELPPPSILCDRITWAAEAYFFCFLRTYSTKIPSIVNRYNTEISSAFRIFFDFFTKELSYKIIAYLLNKQGLYFIEIKDRVSI